jgi:hypothetical protein
LTNQRRVFEEIAKFENFDPLIAENWYKVSTSSLFGHKVCARDVRGRGEGGERGGREIKGN